MNLENVKFSELPRTAAAFAISVRYASTSGQSEPEPEEFAAEVDRRHLSDPNKRVCRTIRPTGIRLGERACKPDYEWTKIEAVARYVLSRVQQEKNTAAGGGGAKGLPRSLCQ